MSNIYLQIVQSLYEQTQENIYQSANALLKDTNKNIPVDTGELKASGRVVSKANQTEVIYDAEHAVFAHEIPTHSGYKFLEKTANQNMKKYVTIINGGK